MKKCLAFLLIFTFLFSFLTFSYAEGINSDTEPKRHKSGDFEYVILENGTAEITDYNGNIVNLSIPDKLDEIIVAAIGGGAFYSCESLLSITIPDTVIRIDSNPFWSCEKLKDIVVSPDHPYLATINGVLFSKPDKRLICYPCALTMDSYIIPKGIQVIGESAFSYCKSLKSVTIPDSVTTIGNYAFDWCESLTSVTIPASVTAIGFYAFSSCESLSSIVIPDSMTVIEAGMFSGCESLTSVTIPDSVTVIEEQAFSGCRSLTSIKIPDSVEQVGAEAFAMCYKLTGFDISLNHPYLVTVDGVLFSKPDKCLICYPCGIIADSYTIPYGIQAIGDYAFSYTSLASVTIPDSVTTIGKYAFYCCDSLTLVTIPDSVTTVGEYAFFSCNSLTSVILPEYLFDIGYKAFDWCPSLTVTVFHDSFAMEYCKIYDIKYTYPDANDWLNN